MAVLSEQSNGARSASPSAAELSVVLCADSAAMRRRIVYAMTEHDLQVSLTEVDDPQQLAELEDIDASSIVVFACDVDEPREMAALRRLRRELREPAVVAVSPMATGTGVRRALDAGADGVVFESELRVDPGGGGPRRRQRSVRGPAKAARQRRAAGLLPS